MSAQQASADTLQRFSFDKTAIRGELAHLNESYQGVLKRHKYPQPIAIAIGELMAATALLSSNLKFPGRLTLQIRLTGNVTLLQAESSEKGQLRAIARYDENVDAGELVFEDGQKLLVYAGKRYRRLKSAEMDDYWGARAQRGRLLPKGYRMVDKVILEKK